MNLIEFIRFLAFLLIAGALFRLIQYRWPESRIAKGLGVLY